MAIPGILIGAPTDRPLRLLAIGAHADDVEIGAGGTILRLAQELPAIDVRWVVLSATGERAAEARGSAERMLANAGRVRIQIEAFRERFFPYQPDLKDWFDRLAADLEAPDLVIGPRLDDDHQDHRTTAELVRQTFRTQILLEYEIPKYEGDLGHPNLYVELTEDLAEAKIAHLHAMFPSQRQRHWFRRDVFRGILALRGVEGGTESGLAEGFTARKLRLGSRLADDGPPAPGAS